MNRSTTPSKDIDMGLKLLYHHFMKATGSMKVYKAPAVIFSKKMRVEMKSSASKNAPPFEMLFAAVIKS